jgi:hypothetical protein
MKRLTLNLIYFLSLFFASCNAQSNKQNTTSASDSSFTEVFFNDQIRSYNASEFKKIAGKTRCNPSGLDTLLQKQKYNVVGFAPIDAFYADKGQHYLYFNVRTGKKLVGTDEYKKAGQYINNIVVLFKQQPDSSYLMVDYFYKPLNQGINSYSWDDYYYDVEKKELHLKQFGQMPPDDCWGTEFVFKLDDSTKKWFLSQANLYEAEHGFEWRFKNKRLIWSKEITKKIPLEEVNYNDYFPYKEIDFIFDGPNDLE